MFGGSRESDRQFCAAVTWVWRADLLAERCRPSADCLESLVTGYTRRLPGARAASVPRLRTSVGQGLRQPLDLRAGRRGPRSPPAIETVAEADHQRCGRQNRISEILLVSPASIDGLDPSMASEFHASCDKAGIGWPCDSEMEEVRDQGARKSETSKQRLSPGLCTRAGAK
jgi:hypothetical protein